MQFLRKSWPTLATIICATALVPAILGIISGVNAPQGHLLDDPQTRLYWTIAVIIFMAGILFALICILLVGAAGFGKKSAPKAGQKQ